MAKIIKNVDKIETTSGTIVDLDNITAGGGLDGVDTTNAVDGEPIVWDAQANQWVAEADLTPPPYGEMVYTTPGTYTYTHNGGPNLCAVCVGGGGGGACHDGNGGSGGALGYKNNISAANGETFTVIVGIGGEGAPINNYTAWGNDGGSSWVRRDSDHAILVAGDGGHGGRFQNYSGSRASYQGDGGGRGGLQHQNTYGRAGGAGAGGYSGEGGDGGNTAGNAPTSGAGGGGAGAWGQNNYVQGGGGGVGLYGEGPSGITPTDHSVNIYYHSVSGHNAYLGAQGGSGGENGKEGEREAGISYARGGTGGNYGGGGGGGYSSGGGGIGGSGAVRIMWGDGRSFPNNAA